PQVPKALLPILVLANSKQVLSIPLAAARAVGQNYLAESRELPPFQAGKSERRDYYTLRLLWFSCVQRRANIWFNPLGLATCQMAVAHLYSDYPSIWIS